MKEFPKIETLFDRDEKTFKVDESRLRMPEFDLIKKWTVTEKVDGTNVRIYFKSEWDDVNVPYRPGETYSPPTIRFGGRTENAQMPTRLLTYLQQEFNVERF